MGDIQEDLDNGDDLDPRIQDELNLLNSSCNDINRLENEIDEARAKYRLTFSDASHKMEAMGRQLKRYIQRARQYYQLKEAAVQAQSEALRAARQFQTANGVYRAAKETISLAEQKLIEDQSAAMLSSAWQEMLNHATIRVMEAEREKTRSEEEHQRRSAVFASLEVKLQFLEKKFKKSILKSRPYFEMKSQLELRLQQQKQNIDDLQTAIKSSKKQYSESLRRLEEISEEIHESRRQKILLMFPREPGVGADDESLGSSISEPNLDRGMFSLSSPGEDVIDSDIDSDDVFDHGTDSPDSASISLSELSRELPGDEGAGTNAEKSEESTINAATSATNIPSEPQSKPGQCSATIAASKDIKRGIVMDVSALCGIDAQTPPEVRESGNGEEQSQICGDSLLRQKELQSGDNLPDREDNPTEGSSDPEEYVKHVPSTQGETIATVVM